MIRDVTDRTLLLGSSALAFGGLALGVLLWTDRWAALAIEAVMRLCG